ncbi:unnamed protein product [Adineta ricciae]|uniref:Transmembrane protein 230 n=1 Tax=Adineta ricciae TaxID=249248 RepID=A0A814LI85_ADIRI|nr:unnamed protein product [Adineta ricciae]
MESADTISPSNIELEEKQNDGLAANRDKKRTRFKSPIRHIFKSKKNDDSSPYYRFQEEKQYSDLQFKEPSVKVPVYAISLAAGLFLVGTVMITLGALMLTGRIETQYSDRTWPLILIGSIVFLPGFYHLRIAYWAWKGDKNFSFADIPDLDWF